MEERDIKIKLIEDKKIILGLGTQVISPPLSQISM